MERKPKVGRGARCEYAPILPVRDNESKGGSGKKTGKKRKMWISSREKSK